MTGTLTGATALVTGGNSGIGRSAAIALADRGAHVVLTGRNPGRGQKAIDAIRSTGGTADFIAASLTDEGSARGLARQAVELGGGHVDILVNNAGIFPFGPTHEATEADFDSVFAVNVKVPFFLVAELAPAMAKRGKGAIVNITTMVAEFGQAEHGPVRLEQGGPRLADQVLGCGVRPIRGTGQRGQPRTDPDRGHRAHG